MKKTIIISAINFRTGGPLSILNDCLQYLDRKLGLEYKIIVLVHKKEIVVKTDNIEFIEFPKSIKSYLYRIYYEYFYFKKLSKELNPYLWFSLHDMSPNVDTEIQAVYCHNSSPFYKISKEEFDLDKKFTLFSWLYKYIYKVNIKNNDYVVVQQDWLRDRFKKMFDIQKCIVSYPIINIDIKKDIQRKENSKTIFFYPSFPRVFKNFEVICEAIEKIDLKYKESFELLITIDGTENQYSQKLFNKYKNNDNIKFIGLQSREKVFELYSTVDCLIFPSKLETWGLPISEFKEFNKPIFVSDLEYAHETVGNYNNVSFFNSDNSDKLKELIESFINKDIVYDGNNIDHPAEPFVSSWKELFEILLTKKKY